jgi:YbbR domain-containing protein
MSRYLRPIFNNFQYKFFALILACLFWYIVQGEEILEINRRIIVNVKTPDGYTVSGKRTRIKDATLRGPRGLLGDFSTKPLEATIHIPKVKKGRPSLLRFRVDKEYIRNWDNRIRLTVHDAYVSVTVDQQSKKKVPIKEYLTGVPAVGYMIENTALEPKSVTITGSKSILDKIQEISTEAIDVKGIQQAKTYDVKLITPNGLVDGDISTSTAKVSLQIGEEKINKQFDSVPIEVVGSDHVTQVAPQFVSIKIQGTPGVLSFVKRSDLRAFVEARDLDAGRKYDREVQVKIPPDTVLIETTPENASLTIFAAHKPN